jgi:hypothetical protein
MAFSFQYTYDSDIEELMRQYHRSLSEKDRRRFAAMEAIQLGHGGIEYIARVLGCDPQTVRDGMRELKQLPDDPAGPQVRKPGGGRKKTETQQPDLIEQVQRVIAHRTAGDPMRQDLMWTDLTPQQIADALHEHDLSIGPRIGRRILDTLGFARRQIAKVLPGGQTPDRDPQFRHLAHLIQDVQEAGNPILSIDTKKKESLGTLYRDGKVYCQEALKAFDPDFASLAQGVIIPHGLYDLALNHGWLHLGLSGDTTEFACDSLRVFWQHDAQRLYPQASAILLLCDGGGSNRCRKHRFKEDLQALVNEWGISIRVAHYPAYCSKFNPIERRLFCHVTRACQGVLLDSVQTVIQLMQKTSTQAGLSVTVRVIGKLYETGRKVSDAFKKNMPIVFEPVLPKWNYWVIPQRM